MVEIDISYEGQLRCSAIHGPSGAALVTDAPRDNQGEGSSFAPTDLLATGVGACMMTTMAIAARQRGIELAGTTVSLRKEMVAKPTRRIGRLTIEFNIPHDLPAEQRAALEWAATNCAAHRSISAEVEVPIRFNWGTGAKSTAPIAVQE